MNESWLMILSAVLLLTVALLLVVLLPLQLRMRRQLQQESQLQRSMQNDLRALCNAAVTVGERIHRVERRLQQTAKRQEELGLRQEQMDKEQGDGDGRAYSQAIKLVQKGASVEELMEVCGLARGEAELIAMMHRLEAGT